ncbi:MAG: YdcF family protein [Chloroflexota bacterium]
MRKYWRNLTKMLTFKRLLAMVFIGVVVWLVVVVALLALIVDYGSRSDAVPSDVIIVLGSGLRRDGRPGDALYRRSVWAARLYDDGYAPVVICTGGVGEGQSRSEAAACAEVLRNNGVPAERIYLEEQSRSTEENALFTRQLMAPNGWETAVLVTDSFHMLRAQWIFDSYAIDHTRSPVPRDWMRTYWYVRHSAREIVALHWQAFKQMMGIPVTNIG